LGKLRIVTERLLGYEGSNNRVPFEVREDRAAPNVHESALRALKPDEALAGL
jgi:hypothetical protein